MIKYIWKGACAGLFFLGLLFTSCHNELNMGEYLMDPSMSVVMTDTVSIKVSNLSGADSVITSGQQIGFIGTYDDPQIGKAEAQTYIEFSRTGDSESSKLADFDSAVLVLKSNGSYYGDTTLLHTFKVNKLVNPIELRDDGYLYSTSTVPVVEPFLIDKKVEAKVGTKPSIEVRLPDEFGMWLFDGICQNEVEFDKDNYLNTFPGLSVSSGSGSNCVFGYMLQDTTCMIRIYYHINTSFKEEKTMTFKANPMKSFYNMTDNKAYLPPYTTKSDPVPSEETGNKGILMSGFPMYARLDFPYLNNFLGLGEIVKIQNATLIVYPVYHSYDTVPLPPTLNLYEHDPTSDTPTGAVQDVNGKSLDGNLSYYINTQYPHYEFDVTNFIYAQLGQVGYNKKALSITIPRDSPDNSISNTMQRLVFGNQEYWYESEGQSKKNRIQLKVTYVTYNAFN